MAQGTGTAGAAAGGLAGKVALVTGATDALGGAIARALAAEGASLLVHYGPADDPAGAVALVRGLERTGCRAIPFKADITDADGAFTLMQSAVAGFGRVDMLVNHAGLRPRTTVEDTTIEQLDQVLTATVRGTFLLTRLVLPLMLAQGHGRIISSIDGPALCGTAGGTLSGAAAGAVLGWTRSLVRDIVAAGPAGADVAAACVASGPDTDPGAIAPAYVLLAGPGGRAFTGQCLGADAGLLSG